MTIGTTGHSFSPCTPSPTNDHRIRRKKTDSDMPFSAMPFLRKKSSTSKSEEKQTISLLRRTESTVQAAARKNAHKVQLTILGARNVGKSSILSQYLFRTFETKYRPTVDEYYIHMFQMEDGSRRILHMIDTAGPHDFPAMQRLWIQQSSAFVVVYSVCDPASLSSAADILKQIYEEKGLNMYSAVLVGNKADLLQKERVSCQEVRALSAQYDCLNIETSAKHCLNIDSIFRCLLMKEVPPQLPQCLRDNPREPDMVKPTLFCALKKK